MRILKGVFIGTLVGILTFVVIVTVEIGIAVYKGLTRTGSGGLGSVSVGFSDAAIGAAFVACVVAAWWSLRRARSV